MTMNVSFDEERATALRELAERQGRSAEDVVLRAVDDYLARNVRRPGIEEVLDELVEQHREILERLS